MPKRVINGKTYNTETAEIVGEVGEENGRIVFRRRGGDEFVFVGSNVVVTKETEQNNADAVIYFRCSNALKQSIKAAASYEEMSVNTWLLRAIERQLR